MISPTVVTKSLAAHREMFFFSYPTISCTQEEFQFPSEEAELVPGIKWGNYCQLYSPAFWKYMYMSANIPLVINHHRIGSTIIEEIVACLLGGYGMPSELGLAAFDRLKQESLLTPGTCLLNIRKALIRPFTMLDGKKKRYRFYNQKSRFIYKLLCRSDLYSIPIENDLFFRRWLMTINGIGPKTASWITRNWLQSENVAILDVHILRAGQIAGFISKEFNVATDYFMIENSYLDFCKALNVLPSNMDAIIWNFMKKTNKLALKVIPDSKR
jgi:N-glycosylase/DNA lyase